MMKQTKLHHLPSPPPQNLSLYSSSSLPHSPSTPFSSSWEKSRIWEEEREIVRGCVWMMLGISSPLFPLSVESDNEQLSQREGSTALPHFRVGEGTLDPQSGGWGEGGARKEEILCSELCKIATIAWSLSSFVQQHQSSTRQPEKEQRSREFRAFVGGVGEEVFRFQQKVAEMEAKFCLHPLQKSENHTDVPKKRPSLLLLNEELHRNVDLVGRLKRVWEITLSVLGNVQKCNERRREGACVIDAVLHYCTSQTLIGNDTCGREVGLSLLTLCAEPYFKSLDLWLSGGGGLGISYDTDMTNEAAFFHLQKSTLEFRSGGKTQQNEEISSLSRDDTTIFMTGVRYIHPQNLENLRDATPIFLRKFVNDLVVVGKVSLLSHYLHDSKEREDEGDNFCLRSYFLEALGKGRQTNEAFISNLSVSVEMKVREYLRKASLRNQKTMTLLRGTKEGGEDRVVRRVKALRDLYLLGDGVLWCEFTDRLLNIFGENSVLSSSSSFSGTIPILLNELLQDVLEISNPLIGDDEVRLTCDITEPHKDNNDGDDDGNDSTLDISNESCLIEKDLSGEAINIPAPTRLLLEVLQQLSLSYRCPWPLGGCVAPEVVVSAYSVVFGFLLRMKVARHSIDLCWTVDRKKGKIPHDVTLIKHHILRFLITMQDYVMQQILHYPWAELVTQLQKALHPEQIVEAHREYIETITKVCLLQKIARPLRLPIESLWDLSLVFGVYYQILAESPKKTEKQQALTQLRNIGNKFIRTQRQVLSLLTSLASRQSLPHLNYLIQQLRS